jgi:hypothetical protein
VRTLSARHPAASERVTWMDGRIDLSEMGG